MRNYELTTVIASDVDEQTFNGLMQQVQAWVEEAGGILVKADQWGRRRLAYSIGEYNDGYYTTFYVSLPPQNTAPIERSLRLSGPVLRHLLIRVDE